MRQKTNGFKTNIKNMGRQLNSIVLANGETLEEELFAVTPHFEGNILKSVMKQLDIECSIPIALGTILSYKLGVLVNGEYEYMDYGNYVVYEVEKQENKQTYTIRCYDKMLYAMKEYKPLNVSYPITVKSFFTAVGNKIGLNVSSDEFYNSSLYIHEDLYADLGYTYRDVLDEIAQAVGGTICVNANDELCVKYPTITNDTIDEEFLSTVNVEFGKKFGPINSIVLSRSAGSDNVYIKDQESIDQNGLCEIKISDNQIMNFNDRADYLPGLLNALGGFYYYINDFTSTGVLYYELCDLYNVQIGENTYQCCMLNDEVNVSSGLKEIIHSDMPEETETDYTKADKTDRRINQTTLIVDKQNQTIEGLVTSVDEQNDKIARIEATTDEIEMQVANMFSPTRTIRGNKTIVLPKCIKGYLLKLRIIGNNSVFDRLYPADDLYPANNLYPMGDSRVIVTDKNRNSTLYELRVPTVLRANDEVYDEYILEDNFAKIIRRVNADGTTKAEEEVENIGRYTIYVEQDENTIEIQNYRAILEATFVEQNAYTDQFVTEIEMESSITQTAEEINTEVRKKVGEDEIISKINQSAEAVTINANKINLNGKTLNLSSDDISITSNNWNVDKYGNAVITDNIGSTGSLKIETPGYYETAHRSFGSIYKGPNGYVNIEADFAFGRRNDICSSE